MKRVYSTLSLGAILALILIAVGCVKEPQPAANTNTGVTEVTGSSSFGKNELAMPMTMPVIDALFFSDERFLKSLKDRLHLTDEQIQKLKAAAREETSKLYEGDEASYNGSTYKAVEIANTRVREIIGQEKLRDFGAMVREHWGGGIEIDGGDLDLTSEPNSAPKDSRIVVNSPAYRMDVFENGKLIKSYKVGIGYPEFPIPTGLRRANQIIFNPSWIPPDEPWVESSSKVEVGKEVPPGDKLNPLGLAKIPIGSPSLIHGGKNPNQLGTFASHGCVGLTNSQVRDFTKLLARIAGTDLTEAQIEEYTKDKTKSKTVQLGKPIPVELRYEPIVVQDGKVYIYRDVYERETDLRENLNNILQVHGTSLEQLSENERKQLMEAIDKISGMAEEQDEAKPTPDKKESKPSTKRPKELVVEVASLKGKGYPAASKLDTGK
jgi:lipoprotein-anchoring transpeptidase ErfK/SrfK